MVDWQVIIKNSSGADILIGDMGLTILNGGTEEVSLQTGYSEIANSGDLKTLVTAGTLVVNDGTIDLNVTDGLAHIRRANKKYVDDQISTIDISAITDPIQTEIDAVESTIGSMSAIDGTFVAPTGTNYINGATSVTDASVLLDTQVKTNTDGVAQNVTDIATINAANGNTQAELDVTQTGAGLNADGTYTANTSANYVNGSTSLKDADNALDAAIKVNTDAIDALGAGSITDLQTELDATQVGAGLATDGSYSADGTTNYITGATSLKNADKLIDAQVKTNANGVASNVTDISTNSSNIAQNTTNIGTNAGNISTNATANSNEVTARTTADAALQTEIDAIETGSGLNADGTYTADGTTNYILSATDLANADKLIDVQTKINADAITQEGAARSAADALKVDKAGDTMSGDLDMGNNEVLTTLDPSSGNSLVRKAWVQLYVQGIAVKASVRVAIESDLDATYDNGSSGVGATLTGNANGALPVIDGITLVADDELLLDNQTPSTEGGVYVLSTVGDAGTPYVLTRRSDLDGAPTDELIPGIRITIREGTTWAGYEYTLLGPAGVGLIPGTDPIEWDPVPGNVATALLQDEVDAVEAGVGLNTDGTYTADGTTSYITGATSLTNADKLLDTQIKANADAVAANITNIATNTTNVGTLDTRTTALEDKTGNFGVINGVVVGKDTVRSKWLGFRQSSTFAVNGKAKNRYLHIAGVPSNLSSTPMAENMTITSLAVQLKTVAAADATINILKNASPVVLGSLVISAGNAGANINTLDIDLAVGDYIQLQVSSTQAISYPVATLTAAFNGGSV